MIDEALGVIGALLMSAGLLILVAVVAAVIFGNHDDEHDEWNL